MGGLSYFGGLRDSKGRPLCAHWGMKQSGGPFHRPWENPLISKNSRYTPIHTRTAGFLSPIHPNGIKKYIAFSAKYVRFISSLYLGGSPMKIKFSFKEFLILTVSSAVVAVAVYFFMLPSKVTVGSAAALALVISNFIPLPVSVITF